jgi:hypothetical protein
VALVATLVLVLITNAYAFSDGSMTGARVILFLALAFALGFGVLLPLIRLNERRAARRAEEECPEFEERLLTLAERREAGQSDPFMELLADDALRVAEYAEPRHLVTTGRMLGFLSVAAATVGVLLWLSVSGPGFVGYGASLLWAGTPRGGNEPFYDIRVFPGDSTVRRGADQLVTAHLMGFQAGDVRLFARYDSTTRWEEVPMLPEPGGAGHEFLFAGLPESVDYYVEAGAVRTRHYSLNVIDLPAVKRIKVTYQFPDWARMESVVEENGGDLRAVEGTEATLAIETDKPLENGMLVLDDETEVPLSSGAGNWSSGGLRIEKDGPGLPGESY